MRRKRQSRLNFRSFWIVLSLALLCRVQNSPTGANLVHAGDGESTGRQKCGGVCFCDMGGAAPATAWTTTATTTTTTAASNGAFIGDDEGSGVVRVVCNGTSKKAVPSDLPLDAQLMEFTFNPLLTHLTNDSLTHFRRLKVLRLSSNALHSIHPTAFARLSRLELLDLSFNRLGPMLGPTPLFAGLTRLAAASLRGNRLRLLQKGDLKGMEWLQELDFSDNRLVGIEGETFLDTPHLKQLDLSGNRFEVIPDYALSKLPVLDGLRLDANRIVELTSQEFCSADLPEEYCGFRRLRSLSLERNKISVMGDEAFYGLTSLTFLSLSFNLLIKPPPLHDLPAIDCLLLEGLRAEKLSSSSFRDGRSGGGGGGGGGGGENLTVLSVAHSPNLARIEDFAFSALPRLKELNISHCERLEEIRPKTFQGLNELRSLDLSSNRLSSLRILPSEKIERVDLSGNPWTCDDSLLKNLESLVKKDEMDKLKCADGLSVASFKNKTRCGVLCAGGISGLILLLLAVVAAAATLVSLHFFRSGGHRRYGYLNSIFWSPSWKRMRETTTTTKATTTRGPISIDYEEAGEEARGELEEEEGGEEGGREEEVRPCLPSARNSELRHHRYDDSETAKLV